MMAFRTPPPFPMKKPPSGACETMLQVSAGNPFTRIVHKIDPRLPATTIKDTTIKPLTKDSMMCVRFQRLLIIPTSSRGRAVEPGWREC